MRGFVSATWLMPYFHPIGKGPGEKASRSHAEVLGRRTGAKSDHGIVWIEGKGCIYQKRYICKRTSQNAWRASCNHSAGGLSKPQLTRLWQR